MSVSNSPVASKNTLAPFLNHLNTAQKEAYRSIERVSSPFELLELYIPSKSKKDETKQNPIFSKIYDYFIGVHLEINLGLKERQNKLIAESLTLADLCQDLPMNPSMREDFCDQLDQINLKRVEALNHLSDLNSIVSVSKIALTGLTAAVSSTFVWRVIQDASNNCNPTSIWTRTNEEMLKQCPSITNPSYFASTAFEYLTPLFAAYMLVDQLSDGGFLSAVLNNPLSKRMAAYNRLSLGIVTRVSLIKDSILNLIKNR